MFLQILPGARDRRQQQEMRSATPRALGLDRPYTSEARQKVEKRLQGEPGNYNHTGVTC